MEKACRVCGRIVEGDECVVCKSRDLSTNFKGLIIVFDSNKSELAKLAKKEVPGKYALKVL